MAQIVEAAMVIKVSKLVKDGEVVKTLIDDAILAQLEAVLDELIGDPRAMIEIIRAD